MTSFFRRSIVVASLALLVVGCSSNSNSSSSSKKVAGLKLKEGPAPLRFVVAQGGKVTVRDTTTGKTIAKASVAPSTAVTVDAVSGVSFGAKVAVKGPLPADHRYQISLDQSP